MYCVIQEIELKKYNEYGAHKELEVYKSEYLINGEERIRYGYRYTGERFYRPIRKAYKISIHKSYRENGKVKKKQWSVCTMSYYDIADDLSDIFDYMLPGKWDKLIEDTGLNADDLYKLIHDKLDPLIKSIEAEFKATEEYKVQSKHEEIIKAYLKAKDRFESEYNGTYEYYYDVFGVLREPEKLEQFKEQQRQYKEYQSSYYSNYQSNYNSNYYNSGYFNNVNSTYTDKEKECLKKIYKAAAMKLHPDIVKDDGESMKFLNKLKEEWGI